jgi:hypothetical protein
LARAGGENTRGIPQIKRRQLEGKKEKQRKAGKIFLCLLYLHQFTNVSK